MSNPQNEKLQLSVYITLHIIDCLRRAVEFDPYNLDALLPLGTSYVNELDSIKALETLRAWVFHNPRFHGLKVADDGYSDGSLMDEVQQLMLAASEWAPEDPVGTFKVFVFLPFTRNFFPALNHLVSRMFK